MGVPEGLLDLSPEEGARRLALDFLDQAAAARERLHDPSDAEALHDFRVGLRRLRSTLRSYRPYLEESLSKKLLRRIRDLARSTGPGRDAEVQIEWLRARSRHLSGHHRAGLAWIVGRLEERMREAYADMIERLPEEFPRIEKDLRKRLAVYRAEVHLLPSPERPTFAAATAGILRQQVLELESHLAQVDGVEDQEEAHEARIVAKRVRYLLEPLAKELPDAGAIVKRLKGLQDLLGELHDAHVLETDLAAAVETAAAERARKLLELSLSYSPDDDLLRVERRRSRETGLIALARLNRARRDRLFSETEKEWLDGRAGDLLRRIEALAGSMESMSLLPADQEKDPGEDRQQ